MIKKIASLINFNKYSILYGIDQKSNILDIGCGNHSPILIKSILPYSNYTGVDIDYYNLDENDKSVADNLFIFPRDSFFESIESIDSKFDLILATHLIEHLDDPKHLFRAASKLLKTNGILLVTTPNINSINFPTSKGTLNYYDDKTHVDMPILFNHIYDFCKSNNLLITKYKLGSTSVLSKVIGIPFELLRKIFKKNIFTTWSYWGFEDIYIIQLNTRK
jgi:SAM-dependent methyltransferase